MIYLRTSVKRLLQILGACALLIHGASATALTRDEAKAIAANLAAVIEANYVEADVAATVGRELRRKSWGEPGSASAFAGQLTEMLQAHDAHFSVTYRTPAADPGESQATLPVSFADLARRRNFGFQRVEVLRGNVGYIDLRMFAAVTQAHATAAGAMALVAQADALIVDLRNNGGGDPAMVQLLCSYFFDQPVHLNSLYWRPTDTTTQFWTLPVVAGARLAQTPLYVLTSPRTASAAEEFAYNMQTQKRATLIGQTTAGAANPGDSFEIAPGWDAFISTGKAVNPVTGKNWERVGVKPDLDMQAAKAFDAAYEAALRGLAENASEPARTDLAWTNAFRSAQLMSTPAEDLTNLVGEFGSRKISSDGQRLNYRRGNRAAWNMLGPIEGAYYFVESDRMRVRFRRIEPGMLEMVEEFVDGFSRGFTR